MRLADLHPQFLGAGGEGVHQQTGRQCPTCPLGRAEPECGYCFGSGMEYEPATRREGVGVQFDCPCGCDSPCFVPFVNPIDGGQPFEPDRGWQRTGDTFDTLKLTPSILRNPIKGGCGWHGFIGAQIPGEVTTC